MRNKKLVFPNLFTFFNLFLGFFSIVKTLEGNLHTAAWLIILCTLVDAMDGKLARWTGLESRFGFQLDSLSDMISFGLAPTLLAYVGIFQPLELLGMMICFAFLFGGTYRLARFNAQNTTEEKHVYMGLTIPIAAMTMASFWIFEYSIGQTPGIPEWTVVIFVLSVLMMSTLPYHWPRLIFDEGLFKSVLSIGILVSVVLMMVLPEKSLFMLLCIFIGVGIGNWTVSILRGKTDWTEFFFLIKRNE